MPRSGRNPSPPPGPAASPEPSGRDVAAASDRELARTAGQEGPAATAAARELAGRHRRAVAAYAARCTATPAATELLCTAAQAAAVRSYASGGGEMAWRPHLLRTVMHTAADWVTGDMRRHLAPELASWLAESGATVLPAPGEETAEGPLLARSFHQLHERQQIVLWHLFVEQEDIDAVGLYTGTGQGVAQRWSDTAVEELRTVYSRLYEESAAPGCRPFSRLVITKARTGPARTVGSDGFDELGGHLRGCEDCSWAFHDMARLNGEDWPPLLAESLLPWSGVRYWADRTRDRAREQPPAWSTTGPPSLSGVRLLVSRTRSGKAVVAVVAAAVVLGLGFGLGGFDLTSTRSSTTNGAPAFGAWDRNTLPATEEQPAGPSVSTAPSTPPSPSDSPDPRASRKPKSPADPPAASSPPGPPGEGLTPARLRWDFRNAGTHPVDTSSSGRSGSYHGHVDWRDDRDGSVWFDGDSFVETSQAVLDTSRSFTVSAWARLTSADGFLTVAGQDGNNVSGFFLQYAQDDDRWRLAMGHQDSPQAGEDEVLSAARPATGTWQHLTGVFDAEKRQIRLYVDGRLQGTAPRTSSWRAGGSFTVGRGLWEGEEADEYKGHVDDVRVFQQALSASQAATLANAGPNS